MAEGRGEGKSTIEVYVPILQPIPTKAPTNPSFWFVTYEACRWWNDIMFPQDG